MMCIELKWITKEKIVYNFDIGVKDKLKFLLMNLINDHNNTMGDIYVTDQLRNNYGFDHCLRQRKWWWSILF